MSEGYMYNRDARYVRFQLILMIDDYLLVWCMKAYHHDADIVVFYYYFLLLYFENNI